MADNQEHLRTEEDVEEILRLAIRQSPFGGDTLRERLQSSADELGISPEALARAEAEWAAQNQHKQESEQDLVDRRAFHKMRVGDFVKHLGSYVAVNAFLTFIDFRDGNLGWAFWPIMGWGIAIVTHLFSLFGHGQEEEKEFRKWQKKRRGRKS